MAEDVEDLEGIDDEYEIDMLPAFPLAVVTLIKKRWGRFVIRVEVISGPFKGHDQWLWARLPQAETTRYKKIWAIIIACLPFSMPESEIISHELIQGILNDTYSMPVDAQRSISYGIQQLWGS